MENYVEWGIRASTKQPQSSEVASNEGQERAGSQDLSAFFLFSLLPLAPDCYRFSVSGLNHSG